MICPFRPRILVIDDEAAIGEIFQSMLGEGGEFLVETETDPFAARQRARLFKPDLIILDVNMPGRNGIEVARQIRAEPWLRHRPILFYSGCSNAMSDCLKAGGDGPTRFVRKGVPLAEVISEVEAMLAERLTMFRAYLDIPEACEEI